MRHIAAVMAFALQLAAVPRAAAEGPPLPREIVRQAVTRELAEVSQPRDYTWFTDIVERKLDANGAIKSSESKTIETLILHDRQFERVVARNGRPLEPKQAAAEEARFDREVAKRAALTPAQREREDSKEREQQRKGREFLTQVPDLYAFRLIGQETVRGRPAWVIEASPNPSAQPKGSAAKNAGKLFGRLWIDTAEHRVVRLEAEARSTIRFGLFLGSLGPGSRIEIEQTRLAEGVWLPARAHGRITARIAIVKLRVEEETTFRGYRRFAVDARIVETNPTQQP